MEAVMGVLLGIGLGAACGFRIFVPLLVAAIAIRGGFLTVTPEFAWLGGTAALVTLSVATLKWGLAAIAGGGAAGIIHGGMAAIRGAASAATGGLGNSVVTTAETASASIVAVLACVLPVAAVLLAAAAIYFLVRTGLVLKRKLRRSPGGPEGEI